MRNRGCPLENPHENSLFLSGVLRGMPTTMALTPPAPQHNQFIDDEERAKNYLIVLRQPIRQSA
jgi:hypothetical protein